MKDMPQNKEGKYKKKMIEEITEAEKSFINLSSIVAQHIFEKQKMDEDDFFSQTIAYHLIEEPRKTEESRKIELKRKMMKILYEL